MDFLLCKPRMKRIILFLAVETQSFICFFISSPSLLLILHVQPDKVTILFFQKLFDSPAKSSREIQPDRDSSLTLFPSPALPRSALKHLHARKKRRREACTQKTRELLSSQSARFYFFPFFRIVSYSRKALPNRFQNGARPHKLQHA